MKELKVRAMSAPWRDTIQFLLRQGKAVGVTVTMQEINEAVMVNPTFELDREDAQILMDDLWNCGLRPTEGTGSAGALAAVKYHLEDMRRLVFEKRNGQ